MHPLLFSFDLFGFLKEPVEIHTYGVLIAVGFLLAMFLAAKRAPQEGFDGDRIIDLAFYLLLWGLVGARVLFIVTRAGYYADNPMELLYFWKGGLVWYGGFIGAAIYLALYARAERVQFLALADLLVPYMALAHTFGRLGCFAAGCCYGAPTTVSWGIDFPQATFDGLAHPTQLYESGFELFLFGLLVVLRSRKKFVGEQFVTWLGLYAVGRSVIEMFRGDAIRGVYILSTSQYVSIAIGALAVAIWWRQRRQPLPRISAL